MQHFIIRSRPLKTALLLLLGLQAVSCGTIMYPERRGQPAGHLDPKVVALDAVGLLFFFVPGVIAFAVDFNNGSIYLPPESATEYSSLPVEKEDWTKIDVDDEELTAARISEVIREQTGKTVSLEPGTYRVHQLQDAEQLAAAMKSCSGDTIAAVPTTVIFRAQSE